MSVLSHGLFSGLVLFAKVMAATRRGIYMSGSASSGLSIEGRLGHGIGPLAGLTVCDNFKLNAKLYVGLYASVIPGTDIAVRTTLGGNWSAEVAVNHNDVGGIGFSGKGRVTGKRKSVDDIAAEVSFKRFKDEPKVLIQAGYNVEEGRFHGKIEPGYETSFLSAVTATATGEVHAEEALPDVDSGSPGTVIVTATPSM